MSVVLKDISKRYGQQLALDRINLDIGRGEIAGLIGPNGAGKTTLVKIITGYLAPSSGEVSVLGMNVVEHSLAIRKMVGYLPEHNPLYPEMYITEYLSYVAGLYRLKGETRKRIERVIEQTGLSGEPGKKICELSKGYRQRVGLAQALLHDPRVLVLDEPTSGLDPNQIVEIRELIRQTGRQKTIILSTHILQEVEAICSRVIIISKGRIVADHPAGPFKDGSREDSCTINVEFDQPVDRTELASLQGVERIKQLGQHSWLIQAGSDHDIRPDIFEFAVHRGLKVLSLHRQQKTLEEVFRALTGL